MGACGTHLNIIPRENALQGIVKEINFPKLIVGEVQLKIKRTRYAAELAKVRGAG
jgi:hypothetical protein